MCGINKFIEEFLFLFILVFKINFSYNNFKEHVLLVEIFYICLNWQGGYFISVNILSPYYLHLSLCFALEFILHSLLRYR